MTSEPSFFGNVRLSGRQILFAGLAALALLLSMFVTTSAQAADYKLGPMDKLRIRVVEWQTAEGAVRDWSMISGDYVVGPSGSVSLPFIGELSAAGKTTAEISATIGAELQQKFGLLDRPEASVELAEFRPVFVSGDVRAPGQYPYAPNLTVLKALSLAGGLRAADPGIRIERDFINARGDHDVLVARRNSFIAKRARLIAEAEGKDEIDFPKEIRESAEGEKLMADEIALKAARDKGLSVKLAGIEDLKKLLQNEIVSLEKKIATQNRQMELSREELKSIGGLADRGLVVNARVLTIERSIADLEGKVLDMETAVLRAKQDISKANQDATTLQNDRDTEVAQERQQTETDIEELDLKITMHRDLMSEARSIDPKAAVSASVNTVTNFSIVRDAGEEITETPADENTPVLPGDVIKVGVAPAPAN